MPDAASPVVIRPPRPEDRAGWEALWAGYLVFYRAAVPAEVTETTWARLHDPMVPVHAFVAERDGALVGLVHYIYHFSTWTAQPYCYLQDLFAAPEARGAGVGRALIAAVRAKAEADGASRVYWLTQEDNSTARALYDKVAARTGFIQYKQPIL